MLCDTGVRVAAGGGVFSDMIRFPTLVNTGWVGDADAFDIRPLYFTGTAGVLAAWCEWGSSGTVTTQLPSSLSALPRPGKHLLPISYEVHVV